MKNLLKVVLILIAGFTSHAWAYYEFNFTDSTGNHLWSDGANWHWEDSDNPANNGSGVTPGSQTTRDNVYLGAAGITIDTNVTNTYGPWIIRLGEYGTPCSLTITNHGGWNTSYRLLIGNTGGYGAVVMESGYIKMTSILSVSHDTNPGGLLQIKDGTVQAGSLSMQSNGVIDIEKGTLILAGNVTGTVQTYVDNGWIIGYGGSGIVDVVYDQNSSLTLVTAVAPNVIKLITASQSQLSFEVEGVDGTGVRLLELPTYGDTVNDGDTIWQGAISSTVTVPRLDGGHDRLYSKFRFIYNDDSPASNTCYVTEFSEQDELNFDSHGWYASGNGDIVDFSSGNLEMTFFEPATKAFDPSISNPQVITTSSANRYFSMRIRFVNAPDPVRFGIYAFSTEDDPTGSADILLTPSSDFQIVSYDLTNLSNTAWWNSKRTLRLDPANGQNFSSYANAEIEIDWIALTNSSSYSGGQVNEGGILWDFSETADRNFDLLDQPNIKGLGIETQMLDDVIALGVKTAGICIGLESIVGISDGDHAYELWDVDGVKVPINTYLVHTRYDAILKTLTDAGITVIPVFLNTVPATDDGSPLIHPMTDCGSASNHLGAFNCAEELGVVYYRAAIEYLANRYSHPDAPAGWFGKIFVIGNEVDAHWVWYNLGLATEDEVVREYARAVRVADMGLRRTHPQFRAFYSLTHHWNSAAVGGDPYKAIKPKTFLEKLNGYIKQEGNFPWQVACHPYPETLSECDFWNDTTATFSFDSAKMTLNNIEILPSFLAQDEFLCKGQPRRIALTEQGFDASIAGETVQAAAYAYAWHKLSHAVGIDTFIYHRHVDWNGTGFNFGLWTAVDIHTADKQRPIYDVFKYADTPSWQTYFNPYLSTIGISSWDEALPANIGIDFSFNTVGSNEGWLANEQISNISIDGGLYSGQAINVDPQISRKVFLRPDQVDTIYISMNVTGGGQAQLFWMTSDESYFDASKRIDIPLIADGQLHEYTIDLSGHSKWVGKEITHLRLDPIAVMGESFSVNYILDHIQGDFNRDNTVDILDFTEMAGAWLTDTGDDNYNLACNLTGDTSINISDLSELAKHWLVSN